MLGDRCVQIIYKEDRCSPFVFRIKEGDSDFGGFSVVLSPLAGIALPPRVFLLLSRVSLFSDGYSFSSRGYRSLPTGTPPPPAGIDLLPRVFLLLSRVSFFSHAFYHAASIELNYVRSDPPSFILDKQKNPNHYVSESTQWFGFFYC